jgi:hypothetical protein
MRTRHRVLSIRVPRRPEPAGVAKVCRRSVRGAARSGRADGRADPGSSAPRRLAEMRDLLVPIEARLVRNYLEQDVARCAEVDRPEEVAVDDWSWAPAPSSAFRTSSCAARFSTAKATPRRPRGEPTRHPRGPVRHRAAPPRRLGRRRCHPCHAVSCRDDDGDVRNRAESWCAASRCRSPVSPPRLIH